MTPSSFAGLCEILVRDGGLRPTVQVTVEQQVAKTLYLLAHNVTNRELSFIFRRSGESVNRHFHVVLRAILGLYEKIIKQPDGSHVPYEISSSQSSTHILRIVLVQLMEHIYVLKFHNMKHQNIVERKIIQYKMY
ncbi:hypothetical protein P3S68_028403 [Capsicum galapagoense]